MKFSESNPKQVLFLKQAWVKRDWIASLCVVLKEHLMDFQIFY